MFPNPQVGPEFLVSNECEVAALDLETLPRSEVGKVDSEFRLKVSYTLYVESGTARVGRYQNLGVIKWDT